MKETALKYGTIGGIYMALILSIIIPLTFKIGFNTTNMVLFFTELAAFIPIYFGIRVFRQNVGGGYLTFWKGFNVGIFITVIICVFYSITSVILYHWVVPGFTDQVGAYFLEEMKSHGASAKELTDMQAQFTQSKEALANPLINAAYAFTDNPLEYGIILTLIFTVILRKKPPVVEISNLR